MIEASERLEQRMLSGEPFTYGERCKDFADRFVDKTIQKLRRKQLIAFERQGNRTVWKAVASNEAPWPRWAGTGRIKKKGKTP